MPPNRIIIISDDNELQYHSATKTHYTYQYIKSQTKKNQFIAWTETEISKLIANNIIKEI